MADETSGDGRTPASGKVPSNPVSRVRMRACDRCKKRKARCDEGSPCSTCVAAKAECLHTYIPQKRGPRPRESKGTTLEQRLAHLEALLASIPHDATPEIGTTGTGTGPPSDVVVAPKPEDIEFDKWSDLNIAETSSASTSSGAGPSPNRSLDSATPDLSYLSQGYTTSQTTAAAPLYPSSSTFGLPPQPQYGESFTSQQVPWGFSLLDANATPSSCTHVPTFPLPPNGPVVPAPQNAALRRNLIYRDPEDQLRYAGASSGLPLLDLLKDLKNRTPSESASEPSDRGAKASPAQELHPADAALSASLWKRASDVVLVELMHELVRAYFSISHLLWPILHTSSFLQTYLDPPSAPPSFVPLVLSMCCLSSRYLDSPLLPSGASARMYELCRTMLQEQAGQTTLETVQTLFNLSVYAEGTAVPSDSLSILSEAVTLAIGMGLHRRVDEYDGFTVIDIELRQRLMYATYCLSVKSCATFGRPPLIRLVDIEIPEPSAVDDIYLTPAAIGIQPADKASIQAGFVAAIRLHMLLERTLEVINYVHYDAAESSFASSVLELESKLPPTFPTDALIDGFARGLPGDWTFSPTAINDSDIVRFFQRTRAYALQQFIRLLIARDHHSNTIPRDTEGGVSTAPMAPSESVALSQVTQAALGIIGCYGTIKTRGRLRLFGVHAIVQLKQAGASLISVILHTQGHTNPKEKQLHILGIEGLTGCIAVLRHLGVRRPAGNKSADILQHFAEACGIPLGASTTIGPSPQGSTPDGGDGSTIPTVRPLARRKTAATRHTSTPASQNESSTVDWMLQAAFANVGGDTQVAAFSTADTPFAFPPPPRFGDEAGGWQADIDLGGPLFTEDTGSSAGPSYSFESLHQHTPSTVPSSTESPSWQAQLDSWWN